MVVRIWDLTLIVLHCWRSFELETIAGVIVVEGRGIWQGSGVGCNVFGGVGGWSFGFDIGVSVRN